MHLKKLEWIDENYSDAYVIEWNEYSSIIWPKTFRQYLKNVHLNGVIEKKEYYVP